MRSRFDYWARILPLRGLCCFYFFSDLFPRCMRSLRALPLRSEPVVSRCCQSPGVCPITRRRFPPGTAFSSRSSAPEPFFAIWKPIVDTGFFWRGCAEGFLSFSNSLESISLPPCSCCWCFASCARRMTCSAAHWQAREFTPFFLGPLSRYSSWHCSTLSDPTSQLRELSSSGFPESHWLPSAYRVIGSGLRPRRRGVSVPCSGSSCHLRSA